MKRVLRYLLTVIRGIWAKYRINLGAIAGGQWIALSVKLILRPGAILSLGRKAIIREYTRIVVWENSSLLLGAGVCVERGGEITSVNGAVVSIGDNTYIGNYCNIRCDKSITIGRNCYIAQFVSIVDGGYKFKTRSSTIARSDYETKPVAICDNVWLGTGVIILPGVQIGEGAVIGAGAVVTKDVPPYAVAVGNPAKFIQFRE